MFPKYFCTYCHEELPGLHIKCVQCHEEFRLCPPCFSCGVEIGPHRNDHRYQFDDAASFPIMGGRDGWAVREEVRLLEAIEQFQYGNWTDISKHVESKTPDECHDHFNTWYIKGRIGRAAWSEISQYQKPQDHTASDNGPLSPSLSERLPPVNVSAEEAMQLGYMPNRDDYEGEYDNDAEKLVSQLYVNLTEDEELDLVLKLTHLDMYRRRLSERARRRRIARDYHLVERFFNPQTSKKEKEVKEKLPMTVSNLKKKLQAEFKDIEEKVERMAQYMASEEHEQLVQSLIKERDLRVRIQELLRYRRNGITSQLECIEYEALRYRRQLRKEKQGKKQLSMFPFHPGGLILSPRIEHQQQQQQSPQHHPPPTLSTPHKKRRKSRIRLNHKKMCTLKRPHICPMHPNGIPDAQLIPSISKGKGIL